MAYFKARWNDCASGSTCFEEYLIFSHSPRVQSDLDMIVTRQWELRNTSSHAYLIQYMQELGSDEKVGNDESCHVYSLQIPFIPVPNACKLLMIPTVKWKQQIWLCQALSCGVWLLAACWGFTVGGTDVYIFECRIFAGWMNIMQYFYTAVFLLSLKYKISICLPSLPPSLNILAIIIDSDRGSEDKFPHCGQNYCTDIHWLSQQWQDSDFKNTLNNISKGLQDKVKSAKSTNTQSNKTLTVCSNRHAGRDCWGHFPLWSHTACWAGCCG